MTQAQLARELGVSEFTVCRYENGRLKMSAEAIRRAAAVFDACPVYFLEGTRCTLGSDAELVELFRRAERLEEQRRTEGDPRVKERKKYGLKKARKAPQFSKR